jgi:hypothetical protein
MRNAFFKAPSNPGGKRGTASQPKSKSAEMVEGFRWIVREWCIIVNSRLIKGMLIVNGMGAAAHK